ITLDNGLPFATGFRNAFEARCIVPRTLRVRIVLALSGLAKIRYAIVRGVAIDMVDAALRGAPMHVEPRETMSEPLSVFSEDLDVTVATTIASGRPSARPTTVNPT